jgi:hypothetical protein
MAKYTVKLELKLCLEAASPKEVDGEIWAMLDLWHDRTPKGITLDDVEWREWLDNQEEGNKN